MEKVKNITKFLSDVVLIFAFLTLFPLLYSLIKGEYDVSMSFAYTILFCIIFFLISLLLCHTKEYTFKYRDGFVISTLVWFTITLLGSLPYYLSGFLTNFWDAFFESASGFSTTGASVISDVEALPKSLQLWRSMTNWIGGMGILVLLSAVLSSWGVNGQKIAFNESTGPSKGKLTSKFTDTARLLYSLYIILTIIMIIILKLCGMSLFDSIIHTFSTVATGGFSNYNDGIMHFSSPLIRIVLIIFMIIAGLNFNLLLEIKYKNGLKNLLKDEEVKCYLSILAIASLLIFIYNILYTKENVGNTLLDAIFQTTSIVTTTGFASTNYDIWPTFSKLILFVLFFTGGCASSTSGGIKCIRLIVCYKLIKRSFSLKIHPNRVANIRINNKDISSDTVIRVTTFILTYFFILIFGSLLLSISGNDFITNLSASASCLGNIGPGFNLIGPTLNFSNFSNFSKIVCSILMIMGRLEIITVFVLFSRNYWNSDKVY